MNEPFELPVIYKGEEILLPARLQQLGFTHRIVVDVYGQEVYFEPDEERNSRAINEQDNQGKQINPEKSRSTCHYFRKQKPFRKNTATIQERRKGRVFPNLSNQKMNNYLKQIAAVCAIQKPFSFHTARHTFATTVTPANGVPIETVRLWHFAFLFKNAENTSLLFFAAFLLFFFALLTGFLSFFFA